MTETGTATLPCCYLLCGQHLQQVSFASVCATRPNLLSLPLCPTPGASSLDPLRTCPCTGDPCAPSPHAGERGKVCAEGHGHVRRKEDHCTRGEVGTGAPAARRRTGSSTA